MRHIKKIISTITALALVLSMSGCYWEGKTKNQSEKAILNELEERYGEEFFVRQMGLSSRTGRPVTAYCSPKDDEEIIFEVALYQFGNPQMLDTLLAHNWYNENDGVVVFYSNGRENDYIFELLRCDDYIILCGSDRFWANNDALVNREWELSDYIDIDSYLVNIK